MIRVDLKASVFLFSGAFSSLDFLFISCVLRLPRKPISSISSLLLSSFNVVVLTKGGMYVGKGYLVDGLFKANVAMVDKKFVYLYPKLINKEKSSIYLLESSIL